MRTVFLSNGSLAVLYYENYIRGIYYPLLSRHHHCSFGGRFRIGI